MSKYYSHLASAKKIIEGYDGSTPLVHHLKKYFSANKKHGSRDRKMLRSLCYDYFRTAHSLTHFPLQEQIIFARFLTQKNSDDFLEELNPQLAKKTTLSLEEKLNHLGKSLQEIFPFVNELAEDINAKDFVQSLLVQPDLFLRVRPQKHSIVSSKLNRAGLEFNIEGDAIRLSNAVDVGNILRLNEDVVVQDFSSQKVLDYIYPEWVNCSPMTAWDCCAASGGKSILLYDKADGNVTITATDIRDSILQNYKRRMREAKVSVKEVFAADIAVKLPVRKDFLFDIIICDVPCTGSGTWARTPEQLYFFKTSTIGDYATKQQKIAETAFAALKKGGLFFYITCSVFKKENEDVVQHILKISGAKLLHQQYHKGYNSKADTLFSAVITI